jgi:hypothetical protein
MEGISILGMTADQVQFLATPENAEKVRSTFGRSCFIEEATGKNTQLD